MARQQVDIGVEGNDGTGDSIRESFKKVNENFQELYAVFGIGGQISFTDLSDTPDTYEGNENKVPTVRSDGSGINLLELASNNALDGSIDTIGFDFSIDGKLIIRQLVSRVSNDPEPTLSGPLNAATQPIAGVTVSQAAIDTFNSVYGTDYDLGDLVINKSFADRNYQEKEVAGGGARLADEPADVTQYTITATGLSLNNFIATNHGLSAGFTGSEFIFRTTGTPPNNLTNEGSVYIRIVDANTISFYNSESDAVNNIGRIPLSGGTGTFTITDAAYDPSLPGNWLSNVAIPRKSAVRRQGDIMTGALNLFDHPGELAGIGLPNGPDDLQAATKLYVDNVAAASQVNLFVSTTGNDLQTFTPDGKQGRAPAYAFRTINAAARSAEEIIEAAPFEPGPYMQTMTFNNGAGVGVVTTAGIASPIAGRNNARTLILANKEFIAKEVTGYLDATFPAFAGTYNNETVREDIEYILDSVSLDALLGDNANYLSRWSGIRYYSNVSGRRAIGSQRVQTIAGIEYAKTLVTQFILTNTAPSTLYQNRVAQSIQPLVVPDAAADNAIGEKFDIVLDVINDGVLNAPSIVDGQTTYKLNVSNGNFGFIDQANPENTDIIPGKVVRGKNSGAIGRIIDYNIGSSTDEIEIQLLEPFEFEAEEELEYGNIVRETQITIRVESGIYKEDYPIRVPANVSIKGDEFRRVIVRPKLRVSQSRWVNTFFYRDAEFDGLVLGKSSIETVETVSSADANRTAGVYTVDSFVSTGQGTGAEFEITIDGTGAVSNVVVTNAGVNFVKNELITISDNNLGEGGAADVILRITKVPNGIEYVNPLTGNVDGYFGYHYLLKPDRLRNTGSGYENVGNWEIASLALIDNREFIQEQTVNYIEEEFQFLDPGTPGYNRAKYFRDTGLIVDALVKDLRNGGNEFSLEAQGKYHSGAVDSNTIAETVAGIEYIAIIAKRIIRGLAPVTIYGPSADFSFDNFNGDGDPALWQSGVTYRLGNVVKFTTGLGITTYYTPIKEHISGSSFSGGEREEFWRVIDGPETVVQNLVDTVAFAFNVDYNPPLRNDEMDAFLMNDATILRNLTVQGHGGFMLVLDPEGQVLTKSPYVQTGSSFSRSRNRQVFSGGLFVDAFVGNSAVQVSNRVGGSPFRLSIQSLPGQGLFVRRPQTPCVFYIDGRRFQVNAITQYDPNFGTAELILDPGSNEGQGFTGITSVLLTGVDLDDFAAPIPITLQTAGNRSILGNDFTQVNDLGYGLVAVNGALSEMVSMFTYYCHVSYYAKNGSEIRSLTGSSCYGEFGLIAEGADPNEIPDSILLAEDMTQPAKIFSADAVLYLTGPIVLQSGDIIQQVSTGAVGTVSADTSQSADNGTGSSVIYLTNTIGAFDTTNQLNITSPTTGSLGPDSVPQRIDNTGYGNARESLSLHVYDMKDPPSNRSEFDIYHPLRPAFARYEVANAEIINHVVGGYENVGTDIPYIFTAGPDATGTEAGAVFKIKKTINNGYTVDIINGGTAYGWNDSFVVSGSLLGGTDGVHDCTITVDEIDDDDSTDGAGIITQVSAVGTIFIEATTPVFSGTVYKLNFSTSDAQFSDGGLLEAVPYGVLIQYRRNQTHIISDLARPDTLTIRPSTAVIFDENPEFVYRSISFLTSNSIGTELPNNTLQVGFDSSYDYIRLIVDSAKAQESALAGSGTTKGSIIGDVRIAVRAVSDENEIFRLNNNLNTSEARRPIGWTVDTLRTPPIITWQGKKHYVFNYRGVRTIGGVETEVPASEDNEYAIVDIADVGEEIIYPATSVGLASSMILGSETVTLRAGLQAGATGDVTINISTCRATGHDFLDIGTGGFNASNYPNVIFGEPAEKNAANEVDERGKGRVFFVSTDQNGIFRVGRFFSVDQGTGTVTFSASIALSDVDGLGFKRGVVVTEFSTDTAMTDNASDTVPTELAVRGFVNRRLGYDVNGNPVANKLGPGVLAPNGAVPMTGDLNAAGNTITNLKAPATDSDAATKAYVDNANAGLDELQDLRSLEYNNYAEGQLLVATGFKKLIISAGSIVGGPFVRGQTITGNVTGATGSIVDVKTDVGFEGNIVEITYTALTGEFSDGKPAGVSPDPDVVLVAGGPQGLVVDGPIDEWANGVANTASDLTITTNKEVTVVGSTVTDRFITLNFQIKANSIVNSDVNASANISQSKLNINTATTRANATAISQADLGVASFNDSIFESTSGWVDIKVNGIGLGNITQIASNTVLGNSTGSTADVTSVDFSTVITNGGGLADADFVSIIGAGSDPGEALIKTGPGTYGISNVTTSGEVNSIVKTRANGSIQANSLILGGDSNFEILSLATTTVVFKTPAQGEILRAVGGSGGVNPTFPTVQIPGNVNIANTGVTESVLQNQSTLTGESRLAVDWIYSSFIEAPGERGSASTGVAIGAGTGITTARQIAIVTADTSTNSSVTPFVFSSTGVVPDINDRYDIGSETLKYKTIYASSIIADNVSSSDGGSFLRKDTDDTMVGNLTMSGNILSDVNNTRDIGTSLNKFNTVHATTFSGALSGNATTATTLQTARTIGGVSFNGSANINLPGVNTLGNQNTTGSAATLTTARTIGGVSFNGSANINLPGVNTLGNQNTTGSAASLTTARTLTIGSTGKTFNGTANVAWSLAEIGVNNSTLTLATSGIATGSQTWTSNQDSAATFTVNVPATNLSVTAGTTAGPVINSSTGTNVTIPSASGTASGIVTTGTQTFAGAKTFSGNVTGTNLTLSGNLTVNGTTTALNTTNTVIKDNLIELNNGVASNANDSGIVIERGTTGDNAFIGWDESADKFIVGTTTATGTGTGNLTITAGTLVASTFEGNLTGAVTGNASTATTLQTARTIGGVSFNGSANINLPGVNTLGNQNTTGSAATLSTARTINGVSFNGSANITLPTVNTSGNQTVAGIKTFSSTISGSINGNAVTATTLQTARLIGGVSFNGSANINLPGVNTVGNQNTTGSAATLTTARTIGGVSFNGSANINLPGVNIAGNQNTTGSAATLTTARTIGGVSFNGSANINLPGVNTVGNQNTTGSAATLSTARTINGVSFNGSANITLPTVNTSGNQTIAGIKTFSSGIVTQNILPDSNNTRDIGSTTLKYANVYATTFRGTATEAYYADLAENYLADGDYEPGTVLVFGGTTEVTVSTEKDTHRVAGVVTTNPAHLMNSHLKGEHVVGIALQGRVPCKVIGRVSKGDLLVASAVPGYAMTNNSAGVGTVIGKALENKFDTERGTIEVVVGKH